MTMWNRDWQGWHIIAIICGAVTASAAMITPANLGLTQITANWIILLSSLTGTICAALGSSGLPGTAEKAQMVIGAAVTAPTVETKRAAVVAINSIPVAPVVPVAPPDAPKG